MTRATPASRGAGRGGARHACALMALLLLSSACTRSGDPTMGITPRAPVGDDGFAMPTATGAAAPQGAAATAATASPVQMQALPATAAAGVRRRSGPVQFLPVVGAPPEKVAMLSQALSRSAAEKGVTILPSGAETAPFRLKGYLSALGEGDGTVVVYVWDVVDPAGNRVSRIQGQERVGGTGADPWDGVGESAFAAIAGRTIDAFLASGSAAG